MAVQAGMHALRRTDVVHLADIKPRSDAQVSWERVRHRQAHWFVECCAEFVRPPVSHLRTRAAALTAIVISIVLDGRVLLRLRRCVTPQPSNVALHR